MASRNETKTNDWEVASYFSVGAGEILGAQRVHFVFMSKRLNARKNFKFTGAGLTVGTLPVGVSCSGISKGGFTRLHCDSPFSLDDLNWTSGRLSSATVAAAGGVGVFCISAGFFPSLFTSQNIWGESLGVDIALDAMIGVWQQTDDKTHDYRIPGQYYGTQELPAVLDKKRIEEAKKGSGQ